MSGGRGGAARAGSTPRVSATRPASARPAARASGGTPARGVPRAEQVQTRVPRLFTVRVMVLGVVTMIAFVLVFPTLRSYLAQRVELEQLTAQAEAARARNDDLNAAVDRWSDDAYVIAQARARLGYVLPGETAYRVADPENAPASTDAPAVGPMAGAEQQDVRLPWYATVWESVRLAGEAELAPPEGAEEPAAP